MLMYPAFLLEAHLCTHIDSPYHFLNESSKKIGDIPLSKMIGNCVVIDISRSDVFSQSFREDKLKDQMPISRCELEKYEMIFQKCSKVPFKTNNS
ncbi:MAG: cyclase family protein, partial [Oligoflexia bacterium]|nr:cyclase family protein [Oligoflexia bacterium]